MVANLQVDGVTILDTGSNVTVDGVAIDEVQIDGLTVWTNGGAPFVSDWGIVLGGLMGDFAGYFGATGTLVPDVLPGGETALELYFGHNDAGAPTYGNGTLSISGPVPLVGFTIIVIAGGFTVNMVANGTNNLLSLSPINTPFCDYVRSQVGNTIPVEFQ